MVCKRVSSLLVGLIPALNFTVSLNSFIHPKVNFKEWETEPVLKSTEISLFSYVTIQPYQIKTISNKAS